VIKRPEHAECYIYLVSGFMREDVSPPQRFHGMVL